MTTLEISRSFVILASASATKLISPTGQFPGRWRTKMIVVYWQSVYICPGMFGHAFYFTEQDMAPYDESTDHSYWIVPGTLED